MHPHACLPSLQCRGVPKLDSAQGNKQVWHPMFQPRSFGSKCTVLKKVLVAFLGLFGTFPVILAHCSTLDPLVAPCMLKNFDSLEDSGCMLFSSPQCTCSVCDSVIVTRFN